jgi:hypothetical protein
VARTRWCVLCGGGVLSTRGDRTCIGAATLSDTNMSTHTPTSTPAVHVGCEHPVVRARDAPLHGLHPTSWCVGWWRVCVRWHGHILRAWTRVCHARCLVCRSIEESMSSGGGSRHRSGASAAYGLPADHLVVEGVCVRVCACARPSLQPSAEVSKRRSLLTAL